MILDMAEDSSDPFTDASGRSTSPTETILPDYASEATRPPSYMPLARPRQPVTYTFATWNSSLMLLLPPTSSRDRSPICNITVTLNLNPFAPLSYMTTVRRGGMTDGPLLGEFEIGSSNSRPTGTVKMGDRWTRLSNILFHNRSTAGIWKWKLDGVEFRWDCRTKLDDGSPMCICSDYHGLQLASFVPPPIDASPPLPDATLTVFPNGHESFDHILISALVVARKMTI